MFSLTLTLPALSMYSWLLIPTYLYLDRFVSIFEVFAGVGFVFYGLAKLENFLNFIVDLRNRSDIVLFETIDSNLQHIQSLSVANSGKQVVSELNRLESKLNRVKKDIEAGKERILLNSRHFFLILGIQSFFMLFGAGIESHCNVQELTNQFYTAIFFGNLFFLGWYLFFNEINIQKDREESVIKELIIILLLLALIVIIGWLVKLEWSHVSSNLLILFSISLLFLPLVLLLLRHRKLDKYIQKHQFKKEVEDISTHIVAIKNQTNIEGLSVGQNRDAQMEIIRKNVGEGQARAALDGLILLTKREGNHYDEALVLSGKFHQLETERRLGLKISDELSVGYAQINMAILEILSRLEK